MPPPDNPARLVPQQSQPQPTPFQERRATLRRVDPTRIGETESPVPGLGPRAGATLVGASQGARLSMPVMGGAAGTMFGGPLGGVLGIGIGEGFRRAYEAATDVPTVDELPDELRPFGVAGEIAGGSPVPGMLPLAATGSAGAGRVGRFIDRITSFAQRRTGQFTAQEATSAGGAAVAGGVASAVSGGNPLAEAGGAMVGGFANPGSRAVQGAGALGDFVNRLRQSTSETSIQSNAAREIRRVLQETGEIADEADAKKLAQRLRRLQAEDESLPRGEGQRRRTSAQLTDSVGLRLLEAELGRRDSQFGRRAQEAGADSLAAMRQLIGQMAESGDPQLVRQAAEARDTYFNNLLSRRLEQAEARAVDAARRVSDDDPSARPELGRQVREILDSALSDARRTERHLWGEVPQREAIEPSNTLAEANRIAREELAPGETLSEGTHSLVERATNNMANRESPVTVQEMLRLRGRLLEEARTAAVDQPGKARRIGRVAEAILSDLEGVEGVDTARAYSRQLNDVFTRSFVGDAQGSTRAGGERLPPELLVHRASAGPAEAVNRRLQELENALSMNTVNEQGELVANQAGDEMLAIQERMMRLAADRIVDPRSGQANARTLNRFVRDNQQLLERFPGLRETLRDVESANQWLERVKSSGQTAQRRIQRQAAFARVAQSENPVREVGRVISSDNPSQRFSQLARMARNEGETATLGLRSSVLQEAFERAGGNSPEFSWARFRNALTRPPRPGQPSAMELMSRNGVIDSDTKSRLTRLLDEAENVETALREKPQLENALGSDEENLLFDFANRFAGARMASASSQATGSAGGHSIVIAGAGSRLSRKVMDKIPAGKRQEAMIAMAENPGFMATMLEKPQSTRGKISLAKRANAWLASLGLAETDESEQQLQQGIQQQTQMLQQ